MIATDAFTRFARRMASTQGCPYAIIAETPNPIRQLEAGAIRARAEAMIATIAEGLTMPPEDIARRLQDIARQEIHPEGVVRSAVLV